MKTDEEKWNETHKDISYKRALEIEGVKSYPRISAAIFNFHKLTEEEKRSVLEEQRNELKSAKNETKKAYKRGKELVTTLKGTDFAGRSMDEHKAALKYERIVFNRIKTLETNGRNQIG